MIEYYEFQNFAGKQLPPFQDFFYRKSLLKIVFFGGQNFFNWQSIFKILQHILGQTKRRIGIENILPTVKLNRKQVAQRATIAHLRASIFK